MKKILFLLLALPVLAFSQQEINKPAGATYFVAYDSVAGVYHAGMTLPNQVTTSGQPSMTAAVNEIDFLQATSTLPIEYDTLPAVGEQVVQGIYEYNGNLVICRQDHIRTEFPPEQTPALFAVYQPGGDGYLSWIENEIVYPGQIRDYNGQLYECIQQHQTLAGQTPDVVPALWNEYSSDPCPQWVQPTGAQDAYPLGACVTHNGQEWIATVDANVWEPGVFGWVLQ